MLYGIPGAQIRPLLRKTLSINTPSHVTISKGGQPKRITVRSPERITLGKSTNFVPVHISSPQGISLILDAPYVTGAVHFNGSSWLSRGASLSGWTGAESKATIVFWHKLSAAADGVFGADSSFFNQGATGDGSGHDFANMQAGATYFDGLGTVGIAQLNFNVWHSLLISADISGGTKICQMYDGDTDAFNVGDFGPGIGTNFHTMSNFFIGQDGFGTKITGDLADLRIWTGTALDFSNVNNRRLFVRANGKPANPGAAQALLGTPIVKFMATPGSEVATWVNGGSGGSFTTSGTLTAASTSPTT